MAGGVTGSKSVCAVYAGTQTNASVISAPAAGYAIVIHYVNISNGATAGEHKLLDGSGGTVTPGSVVEVGCAGTPAARSATESSARTRRRGVVMPARGVRGESPARRPAAAPARSAHLRRRR